MENADFPAIFEKVCELPPDFHEAGVMSDDVLYAIVRHAEGLRIENSMETGCGKSTLLLSWLSRHHTVFTLDKYGELPCLSYERVSASALLNADNVSFVPGPTQRTLPRYPFEEPVQLALIDGPHGFPFPFLEYYYFYPFLQKDGLLIVDDIHIPTIRWLHDFLVEDDMFEFIETVENSSFFRRTEHPALNPFGDDWWLQRYNANRINTEPSTSHISSGGIFGMLRRQINKLRGS